MTDQQEPRPEDPRERIEEARSEAAAYVVQVQPEGGVASDLEQRIGAAEERIVDVVQAAQGETDPAMLDDLADKAEAGRDEIKSEVFGTGPKR